ncbi:WD40/YVTN/BNR-like repeat-containing protein [Dyadobacter tibetensis]|uniref:WD40/YVTN/BNR-like repeat-containing protein n=1 Tax=Dyadobacter tibetensis TaxID=1211851 RepID=UPI00046F6A97|nr:oxidoreductase [Dyadobacter tibetensis]
MLVLIILGALGTVSPASGQWQILDIGTSTHMRAVHTVTPTLCWIGSAEGKILKTTDGGKTWATYQLPQADSLDFRDIHAFNKKEAIAMSAGLSQEGKARIYRTEDGGLTWQMVYQTRQPGIFLDGIAFWNKKDGICQGDPVDGRFFILRTHDGGRSWQENPIEQRPVALPQEACYAASGTSMVVQGHGSVWIGTGGSSQARVLHSADYGATWDASTTPLPAGPTSGIFGLRFLDSKHGIAVGGDYKQTQLNEPNVLTTADGGKTWTLQEGTDPAGLKECVDQSRLTSKVWNGHTPIRQNQRALVAVGPSGTSLSVNGGQSWKAIDHHAFHATSFAGSVGYAVGPNGRVGIIKNVTTYKRKTSH